MPYSTKYSRNKALAVYPWSVKVYMLTNEICISDEVLLQNFIVNANKVMKLQKFCPSNVLYYIVVDFHKHWFVSNITLKFLL